MGQVMALVLSGDEVDDLHDMLGARAYQPVDSERALKMMLQMFKSRAEAPVRFVLLYENRIGIWYGSNVSHELGYVAPDGEWKSSSGWFYVIGRDHGGESVADFTLLAELALALCSTFPDVCASELAASMRQ